MALTTFAPDPAPGPFPVITPEIRVRRAEFGDGYTQTSADGLNHIRQTVELTWDALSLIQKNQLEAFFVARGGYQSFYYTPFGFAAPVKWTCGDWSWSGTAPFTFRAVLRESFTAET